MTLSTEPSMVVVARLHGAYGIKGWSRVESFTEPAGNLLDYDNWMLEENAGWRRLQLVEIRAHKNGFVACFAGVDNPERADALRGRLVAIPAEALPAPGRDEYYWRDLVGLAVYDQQQQHIGVVAEVLATGANDVLVVESGAAAGADGAQEKQQELIPFDRRYVTAVDVSAGRLTVAWEGLEP